MKPVFFSMAFIVFLSCIAPQDEPVLSPPDPYAGCCGTEAVEFQLNNSLVFIPNMFTPNGDGLNDLFKPLFNEDQIRMESFTIKSLSSDKALWSLNSKDLTDPFWGWRGSVSTDSTYVGRFLYTATLSSIQNGEKKTISGSACCVVCKNGEKIPITTKKQCFFPVQYINDSVYHTSPIYLEVDCLK